MDNSDGIPPKNGELFGTACAAAEKFPDFITPDEAMFVDEVCRHNRELYIRCMDCELEGYVKEVGGLDLSTIALTGLYTPLPLFIPIAEDSFFDQIVDVDGDIIGVQLQDVVEKASKKIHTDLLLRPLLKGKRVILFLSGRDDLIERVWDWRHDLPLFEQLGRLGLLAATGINFSVFESMCPFGQHFNIKKSLVSAALLEQAGVPSIPHFYSVNPTERQQIAVWLNGNQSVRLITINCQAQKSDYDLAVLKASIRYLLSNTRQELHIILEGFRISNLVGLDDCLPFLHIAQKQPFMDGLNYKMITFNPATALLKEKQVRVIREAKANLITQSIRARKEQMAHIYANRVSSGRTILVSTGATRV